MDGAAIQVRSNEIQLAIHSWDLGGPGGTSHPRLLPSKKSIYSLSVYGWLSFEHRLKFSLDVENGAPK
jgi:hypothetical protein